MKDWKISMPDGWKPGENGETCSEACPFFYSYTRTGKQFCYPHKCPLASAVEVEPKDCGFTLSTCPYERCSGITMRKPVEVEPLACLADRKGYFISVMWTEIRNGIKEYCTQIKEIHEDFLGDAYTYFAPTYAECEAKARAFLAGLPDRPTKGEGKEGA